MVSEFIQYTHTYISCYFNIRIVATHLKLKRIVFKNKVNTLFGLKDLMFEIDVTFLGITDG